MQHIIAEAARRGLWATQHPVTGHLMIDGLRADLWWRLKDEPNRRFVGTQLVKDYN